MAVAVSRVIPAGGAFALCGGGVRIAVLLKLHALGAPPLVIGISLLPIEAAVLLAFAVLLSGVPREVGADFAAAARLCAAAAVETGCSVALPLFLLRHAGWGAVEVGAVMAALILVWTLGRDRLLAAGHTFRPLADRAGSVAGIALSALLYQFGGLWACLAFAGVLALAVTAISRRA